MKIYDIGDRRRVLESEDISPSLLSKMGTGGNNVPIITPTYCLQGGGATSQNAQGSGINEEVSFTMNGIDKHAVCYGNNKDTNEIITVDMQASKGNCNVGKDVSPTLAKMQGASGWAPYNEDAHLVGQNMTVRRLTPTETERLMGFPDGWTKIPWRGKPAEQCPDGPRYKACGNSMGCNVMSHIGMRIQLVEDILKEKGV